MTDQDFAPAPLLEALPVVRGAPAGEFGPGTRLRRLRPEVDDMTRTEEALLAAVIAAPADDLPRLAYADFREEQGDDARAEFIRVQVRLARGCKACDGTGRNVVSPCPCALLRCREREVLGSNPPGLRWIPYPWPRRGSVTWDLTLVGPGRVGVGCEDGRLLFTFRRGFVAGVALPCAAWLAHGPALVRAAPLEAVTLADRRPVRGEWAAPGDDVWWWVRASRVNANRPEALPPPLFRALALLRREERRTGTGLGFADRDLALLDLSEAALAWARAAAVAEGEPRG